jgi:hypothetical protein
MKGLLPADQPREVLLKSEDSTDPEYGFSNLDKIPIEHLLDNGVI